MSLIPALQVGLFPWTAICCAPVHADLYTRLFSKFNVKVFQQNSFLTRFSWIYIWEAAALFSFFHADNHQLQPECRTGHFLFDHLQHTKDRIYLLLQGWKASDNGYILALQKQDSETLYKIEINHTFQAGITEPNTGWWATDPSQQCKDTNYLLVHPFPWSLPRTTGHRAGCAHVRLLNWKNIPKLLYPQWLWNLLYKPTSRKIFLATAVKISSPDGVRVLKPTAWQQGPCSTLHI